MKASNALRLAALLLCLYAAPAAAQSPGGASPLVAPADGAPARGDGGAGESPVFWVEAGFGTVFDTNLEHDETNVKSFGFLPSIAFHFQDQESRPALELDYEVAPSAYTNTERFDRVSHALTARFERRLFGRWSAVTEGEASIRGSSEDRDVSNQFIASQRIVYRLTSSLRIEPFYGYRVRRYPEDSSGQDAVNPHFGARLRQRFEGGRRITAGYRYDWNRSQDPRYRYIRRTWEVEYVTPLFGRSDRLTVEGAYKQRTYAARFVEVGDGEVPRRDANWWVLEAGWERPLGRGLGLELRYKFERRGSNDEEKIFSAHQLGGGIFYRWDW
jgi:hypothetical protein